MDLYFNDDAFEEMSMFSLPGNPVNDPPLGSHDETNQTDSSFSLMSAFDTTSHYGLGGFVDPLSQQQNEQQQQQQQQQQQHLYLPQQLIHSEPQSVRAVSSSEPLLVSSNPKPRAQQQQQQQQQQQPQPFINDVLMSGRNAQPLAAVSFFTDPSKELLTTTAGSQDTQPLLATPMATPLSPIRNVQQQPQQQPQQQQQHRQQQAAFSSPAAMRSQTLAPQRATVLAAAGVTPKLRVRQDNWAELTAATAAAAQVKFDLDTLSQLLMPADLGLGLAPNDATLPAIMDTPAPQKNSKKIGKSQVKGSAARVARVERDVPKETALTKFLRSNDPTGSVNVEAVNANRDTPPQSIRWDEFQSQYGLASAICLLLVNIRPARKVNGRYDTWLRDLPDSVIINSGLNKDIAEMALLHKARVEERLNKAYRRALKKEKAKALLGSLDVE